MFGTLQSFDTPDDTSQMTNDARGTFDRPIGHKATKNKLQRKQQSRSDASSVVGDRITAGFAKMNESSGNRWDNFIDRHEEDTFYSIKHKKLKIVQSPAAIEESIIRSEKELCSIDANWLSTKEAKTELIAARKHRLAELEAEAKELRSLTYSPNTSSRRASMDQEASVPTRNLNSRFDDEA